MKAWSEDHPKAKLMARKQAAILNAAREAFLRVGYEGASMEAIASAAGVSIMTLYRHVESKDNLFAAVILSACDYLHETHDADRVALMQQPLKDVLVKVGDLFQAMLTKPEIVALFRAVMVETVRFPHLAEAAYRNFVEAWEDNLNRFLSQRAEFSAIPATVRQALVANFIDNLVGTDALRALLGLATASVAECNRRSADAAERLLTDISR